LHAPQFVGLLVRSTQAPLQLVSAGVHDEAHAPALHIGIALEHAVVQLPQ
jgi:hypothetical protein